MMESEIEIERNKATGNVAKVVALYRDIQGVEGTVIQIERYIDENKEYFFRTRTHDLTGTAYGPETVISLEEALEAKRLRLTPLPVPVE